MNQSWKHRIHQSLCFEAIALLLIVPIVSHWMEKNTAFWLLVSLSVMVCCWTPVFNALFDKFFEPESKEAKRHWRVRAFHAIVLEVSVIGMATPVISWWSNLSLADSMVLNIQISGLYIVYAYVFFFAWDKITAQLERQKAHRT